jgi:hypothetical protein
MKERTASNAEAPWSILLAAMVLLAAAPAGADCPITPLVSGLRFPLGITQSDQGNVLVAEAGTLGAANSGRVSIVGASGVRRTLVDGLPSGTNDVGEPSGPAGLFMRGRTLYLAIGIGDAGLAGPFPGAVLENPAPSSALFSSVLAIRFTVAVENVTTGFMLRPRDHVALAVLGKVNLTTDAGERATVELIANFPDLTPEPLEGLPANQRGVNPFDLVVLGDRIAVTDGGQNVVWEVDASSGAFAVLTTFPQIPNPIPGEFLPPMTDAVPTGVREFEGDLLVTLLSGFPFAQGTSVVEQVDPSSGSHLPLIQGLTTALDVLPLAHGRNPPSYLVLQHASESFFEGDGHLVHVRGNGSRTIVADCLSRPTSIVRDGRTGTLYITEIVDGRVVTIRQRRWRSVDSER